ncbi:hypothetical protein TNCV_2363451 [Trichonephila clavipes]|nr:hypothetical protein TNCV_2363451 [Trichonephila clavipes]
MSFTLGWTTSGPRDNQKIRFIPTFQTVMKDSSFIFRYWEMKVPVVAVLFLILMPPVRRSHIEAHEIHRGKGLEVRLSLAWTLSTIQVTVRISSANFLEGSIDGDYTYLHLHNFGIELKGREIFYCPLHS